MLLFFFLLKTDQGIKNLSVEEAEHLASTNPDYAIGDLFNAIANGNYPSWTCYIQVMTFEQAEKFRFNPFDLTKVRHPSTTEPNWVITLLSDAVIAYF